MLSVLKTIKNYDLFKEREIIGVAVSGGSDSMSLLHFLNENKEKFNIELLAITNEKQKCKWSYVC